MPDEIVIDAPASVPENAPALPETGTTPENAGEPGAPETVEETDEQKNERVQREAAEASAKRAEKQSRGVQKRIDELTADKHAERKRADELADQNRRILALLEGKNGTPAAKTSGAPEREQFNSYEEFLRADARYVAQQEAKALFEESTKAQREAQAKFEQERAVRTAQQTYASRESEIAKTIPDYRETIDESDVNVPQGVFNLIQKMADGPLIAYHIAKQPELAKQFWENANDPAMHGIILGQLSATLKAPSSKISNAPAPGKGVKTTTQTSNSPPSDPNLYFAWAEKHMPKGRSSK